MPVGEDSSPLVTGLGRWLLSDGVQVCGGASDGAVVGWTDDRGSASFVYPEITGYFLSWLAFLVAAHPEWRHEAADRARRAVAWLDRVSGSDLAPTRLRLDGSALDDWRCQAVFAFDVAMVIRGLALAWDLAGPDADALRRRLLGRAAKAFAEAGAELAPLRSAGAALLPDRWATRADVHGVKTAAALLADAGMPVELERAARATLRRWGAMAPSAQTGDLHPRLYQVEGLLLAGLHGGDETLLARAAQRHADVMRAQLADGALPAACGALGATARGDVVAQALRAGCVLRDAIGAAAPSDGALNRLRAALERFVMGRGSVLFHLTGDRHHNTWATMLAHQAMLFHDCLKAGRRLPDGWALGIV